MSPAVLAAPARTADAQAPARAASATPAPGPAPHGFALTGARVIARAQQVFGPLQRDDAGHLMREGRHLRLPGSTRERAYLPTGTHLRLAGVHRVRDSGVHHDVMLWHGDRPASAESGAVGGAAGGATGGGMGGGFQARVAVLAVFRAGEETPLDVAEVQTDRMTFFGEPAVRALGPRDDAFELVNHHADAGPPTAEPRPEQRPEHRAEHSLYQLRGGRLRRIAQVDLLARLDGCAKAFEQAVAWRAEPDAAQPLPRLVAEVTVQHAPRAHTGECRPRPTPHQQTYSARYRWDAAGDRYRAEPGGTMDKLSRWNELRR